jgi:Zn-dependent peptidase ImmA (M78 family)
METIRVGGRRYSDPDVLSLIKATGSLVDPRSSVLTQARKRLQTLNKFHDVPRDPIERLTILASICGIAEVVPMNIEQRKGDKRDALLVPNISGGRSIIYNPTAPRTRVAFSIAHEIIHTFFPNSINGARFRNICASESREANELERLCDLGASELLMPLSDFQRVAATTGYTLSAVSTLMEIFGSSFEATAFRLASAHPGVAATGLLRYRLRVEEQRRKNAVAQTLLFSSSATGGDGEGAEPKYRRQSLHLSEGCSDAHTIRWNKSFPVESVVYSAATTGDVQIGFEALPNQIARKGRLEAIRAPYQRDEADPVCGDVLFFWAA